MNALLGVDGVEAKVAVGVQDKTFVVVLKIQIRLLQLPDENVLVLLLDVKTISPFAASVCIGQLEICIIAYGVNCGMYVQIRIR